MPGPRSLLVVDPYAALLQRLDIKARVFFAGKLCGAAFHETKPRIGLLHLLRQGVLEVALPGESPLAVAEPSLVFFPRPTPHCTTADGQEGVDLVCARVEFGGPFDSPLVNALPRIVVLPLGRLTALQGVLDALFMEAFGVEPGREAAIDRLAEVVLLHLLRHAVSAGMLEGGVIAGLSDVRLGRALLAIHEQPGIAWTLNSLADVAGMSRARFAARFKATVGLPPAEYLALWRITLAQGLLIRGRAPKSIADEVGYASSKALARAFTQRVGSSPTAWLAERAER